MADRDQPWRGGGDTQPATIGQLVVQAINGLNGTISSHFPNWTTPPANSTASGVSGMVAYGGSANTSAYFYVCLTSGATGNATWGRVLLTTIF